jgi:UDP-2,4-diacetamido-2,4,6-trideoxy-beta-L-altropyranose hydrolase
MNKNLIIRADSSIQIGTGHVMRCIALAQAWQDRGGNVTFLSHCDSETLRHRIIDEDFDFIPIDKPHPHPDDLSSTLKSLSAINHQPSTASPWLALDGYHFTPNYQKAIKRNGYKLLVIDDMAHLDHYHADILLNQNIHASNLHYSCDKDAVKLLGCEYALLRREFLKYKGWRRRIPDRPKKILVTMGGSDPNNVTLKAIEAIKLLNMPELEVQVIAGASNPHLDILQDSMLHAPCSMRLLHNASNMPELMAWSDIAVSAAGSTCWELAFMGVASITVVISGNQQEAANRLDRFKIFKTVGLHQKMNKDILIMDLSTLMQDKDLREKKSRLGQQLIDGKGSKNVVCVLAKQCISRY